MEVVSNQKEELVVLSNSENMEPSVDNINNNLNIVQNGNEDGSTCNSSTTLIKIQNHHNIRSDLNLNNNILETLEEVPEPDCLEIIEDNSLKIQQCHSQDNLVTETVHEEVPDRVEAGGETHDHHLEEDEEKVNNNSKQPEPVQSSQRTPSPKSSNKSSNHRVKFTEELPTSTGTYRWMTTSTTTAATTMTAIPVTQDHHADLQDGSHSSEPHPNITISEDFPTTEDRALGTKIDNSYEGWDNPFRPEGEISHDADELLRLWREGREGKLKPEAPVENGDVDATDDAKSPLLGHQNGGSQTNGKTTTFEVKRETIKSPTTVAQSVTVGKDEAANSPKKKTHGCCSLM